MDNNNLPTTHKPEILKPIKIENNAAINNNEIGSLLTKSFAKELPRLINLASEIVQIKNIKIQTEKTVRILQEKGQLIEKEATAYVNKTYADIESFKSKQIPETISMFLKSLSNQDISDDIKKEIIKSLNLALEKILCNQKY